MSEKGAKKPRRVVALNGDKLGMVAGSTVATVVMALCFFVQRVDIPTAAIRVGWAFVVGYAAAFFLTRVILRTTIFEFVIHANEKKSRKLGKDGESGEVPRGDGEGTAPSLQVSNT